MLARQFCGNYGIVPCNADLLFSGGFTVIRTYDISDCALDDSVFVYRLETKRCDMAFGTVDTGRHRMVLSSYEMAFLCRFDDRYCRADIRNRLILQKAERTKNIVQ